MTILANLIDIGSLITGLVNKTVIFFHFAPVIFTRINIHNLVKVASLDRSENIGHFTLMPGRLMQNRIQITDLNRALTKVILIQGNSYSGIVLLALIQHLNKGCRYSLCQVLALTNAGSFAKEARTTINMVFFLYHEIKVIQRGQLRI